MRGLLLLGLLLVGFGCGFLPNDLPLPNDLVEDLAQEEQVMQISFNDLVLEILQRYPTDGSYPYEWTNYDGVTMDIIYQNQRILEGHPRRHSYCSGITFEVFFQAYQAYNEHYGLDSIGGMDPQALKEFQLMWYGVGPNRLTIKNALETTGLGYQIPLDQVRAGDFVQIWRHNGSGHTVVFMGWERDSRGKITGFTYWSSNTGRGIGYATEYFGTSGKTMIRRETYFMRVMDPREFWAVKRES